MGSVSPLWDPVLSSLGKVARPASPAIAQAQQGDEHQPLLPRAGPLQWPVTLYSGSLHQPGLELLRTTLKSKALPTDRLIPDPLLHDVKLARELSLYPSWAPVPVDLVHF